ncbi:MBL fold metallo-hydrolase [Oceanobacillus longus]|uniref:MBL fold metallo-hydrolase n=1 Tax=Oceanobacillus longus TaxID=930120 RepID=A0ABV8H496_9BACI
MEIQLLGTSAAEGFPGIFCNCDTCQDARKLGGKDIRTRTSALIDGNIKIDFPPDSFLHVLRDGKPITNFEHLIITHTHHDHFYLDDLRMRTPGFATDFGNPLTIYGNQTVVNRCKEKFSSLKAYFNIVLLHAFETYEIDGSKVTPLPADHKPDEESFIYFIEKDNRACLYGHDTGMFPEETFHWLSEQKIDVAILDCTNGLIDEKANHMNIAAIKEINSLFMEKGVFHKDSQIIATHFSHNTGLLHKDLKALLEPNGIGVAYDGMVLTV